MQAVATVGTGVAVLAAAGQAEVASGVAVQEVAESVVAVMVAAAWEAVETEEAAREPAEVAWA